MHKLIRYDTVFYPMGKRTTELTEISTYIEPEIVKKAIKKRGNRGLISWSAYLRVLVIEDLAKK